jgi:Transglycosylase SLT domain
MNPLGSLVSRLASEGVNYAPEIVGAAQKYGLDPNLLAAVAAQETGGPGANGGKNEVGDGGHGCGLFQIDDRWHDFAKTAAAMDPAQNADYAAGMLSGLLKRYNGNVHDALSAYNSGDPHGKGTSTTWGDGQKLDYADSVMRHYQQIGGDGEQPDRLGDFAQQLPAQFAPQQTRELLQQPQMQAQSPLHAPRAHHHNRNWRAAEGLDPTGHGSHQAMSYDTYINGGDNP